MQPRRQHQITRIRKPLIVSRGRIHLQYMPSHLVKFPWRRGGGGDELPPGCQKLSCAVSGFRQVFRDLKIRRRRQQRERYKSNRFNQQNNNFARASRFFVHFFAVIARLYSYDVKMPNVTMYRGSTQATTRFNFLSLSELGYGS